MCQIGMIVFRSFFIVEVLWSCDGAGAVLRDLFCFADRKSSQIV